LKALASAAWRHRLGGEAACIAYYAFLTFFPAVLVALAVTGVVGGDRAFERFVAALRAALPGVASATLEQFVKDVMRGPRPGLLSAGAAVFFWAALNTFSVLTLALNAVFGADQPRNWWRRRALGGLVVAVGIVGLGVGAAVQVVGPEVVRVFRLSWFWGFLRGPAAFTMLTVASALLYRFLPNTSGPRSRRALLAGAAAGTALGMIATLLFRLSLRTLGGSDSLYGIMSGVIALEVWLYLTAFAFLLGAEIAAMLERRWEPLGSR